MKIEDMEAGAEMDAMVAEKVMGWRTYNRNTAWWVDAEIETGMVPSGGFRGFTSGMDRFAPSTNIAAAWMVIDTLSPKCAVLDVYRQCDRRGWWGCRIWFGKDEEHDVISSAPTAPLAICRCALLAVQAAGKEK